MVAPPKPIDITLEEAFQRYLKICERRVSVGNMSAASLETYQQSLDLFVKFVGPQTKLDVITGENVDDAIADYANTPDRRFKNEERAKNNTARKSASSQKAYRNALVAFFSEAKKMNWVQLSPLDFSTLKIQQGDKKKMVDPKRNALTLAQARAVLKYGAGPLENAKTPRAAYTWHLHNTILWVLLSTGLRNAELVQINRDDFYFEGSLNDEAWLQVRGKGGKHRRVPIPAQTYDVIQSYLEARATAQRAGVLPEGTDSKALFVNAVKGKRISVRMVERIAEKASEHILESPEPHLVRKFVPHSLRHTMATRSLVEGEVDIVSLRDILGHANLTQTSAYMDSDSSSMRTASELNPLLDK